VKPQEFAFTVTVRDRPFDVYHTHMKRKPCTIGFCVVRKIVQIAIVHAGHLDAEAAIDRIENGWADIGHRG
jgi:RecB family exonuclease